jgi:CheY-like chemotaxis protein
MSQVNTGTPVLLIVDDDPGDRELASRAIINTGIPCTIQTVEDGEQARDYLLNRGEFQDASQSPKPDLILLDLNMPRMGGREFLAALQREVPNPERIVVVVFSTSSHPEEILESYSLGAKSYLVKPGDIDALEQIMRSTIEYWFERVKLPS